MRLSTAACLTLVLAGLASGCATMRNPLASNSDPQDATRRRMIAEMNARTEKGDIEGARQILARLEASEQSDKEDSSVIPLGQGSSTPAQQDTDKLVDRLVAFDPPALRDSNRKKYEQFSPATLKLMLAEYERTASFGQQNLNEFVPGPAGSNEMYARNSATPPGEAQPVAQRSASAPRSAPDPRSSGGPPALGTQSPWPVAQRESQPETQQPPGTAPRLPDANIAAVPENNAIQGGGLQTVSGEMPARNGIAGSAPGPAASNPFPQAGRRASSPDNQLPVISPGNSGYQNQIVPMAGSVPANRTPATTAATAPFIGDGGVALLNEISAVDDAGSTPLNDFNTGTFPGSSQTVAGAATSPQLPENTGLNPTTPPGEATSAQPGLPGVLGSGVQGVQQIIPKIKDVAGRTLRNFGQGEPQLSPAGTAYTTTQADVSALINQLETELLAAAPGQTDAERTQYIRRHVNLRMLHLVAGDVGQAVEPIPGIASADQEFWQQMIWSVSNYFDDQGMPEASVRSAETIEQLRGAIAQLSQTADLKLRNTTFCHRIVSFGNYDRFKVDRFTTGQPVLLYSEVENFTSLRSSNDGYRTVLQSAIEIYKASDLQQPAETIPLASDTTEDFCRAQRRDYFHSYEFSIPPNLEPGQYTLVLRVVDQQSRKVATSRVNFELE